MTHLPLASSPDSVHMDRINSATPISGRAVKGVGVVEAGGRAARPDWRRCMVVSCFDRGCAAAAAGGRPIRHGGHDTLIRL
ncbi:hypothetical protein AZ19_3063 [Bordetella bronchiseptica E012]|nr:hypothetical protein AZ19_3063 [Bordetella bronchiseptica E012]